MDDQLAVPMSTPRRSSVMADVARRAGVSTMTVSRVLHEHPNVTTAIRDRVRAAVDELGYRANLAARRLAGGRSHVLGTISVQPASWGPSRTVFAIEAAAQAAGQLVGFKTFATLRSRPCTHRSRSCATPGRRASSSVPASPPATSSRAATRASRTYAVYEAGRVIAAAPPVKSRSSR